MTTRQATREEGIALVRAGTAIHESAHAVVGVVLGWPVYRIEVYEPDSQHRFTGFVRFRAGSPAGSYREMVSRYPDLRPGARDEISVDAMRDLAGIVGEAVLDKDRAPHTSLWDELLEDYEEGGTDVRRVLELFSEIETDEDRRWRWLYLVARRTETLVRRPDVWGAIMGLAARLDGISVLEGPALALAMEEVRRITTPAAKWLSRNAQRRRKYRERSSQRLQHLHAA